MSKKVYKISGNNYTIWDAPDDEIITRPFTEKTPPNEKNQTVIGFDWVENRWQTVSSISKTEYTALVKGVADLGNLTSNLQAKIVNLDERLKKLEELKGE